MYPTVVVVLAETQRSMTDICEISRPDPSKIADPAASEAPSSLVGPINSTMDNEAKSSPSRALQSQEAQEHGLEKVIFEVNLKESRVSTSG